MATLTKINSKYLLKQQKSTNPVDKALTPVEKTNELIESNNDLETRLAEIEGGSADITANSITVTNGADITGGATIDSAIVSSLVLNGGLFLTETETRTGAGAISVNKTITHLVTTGANALTLAAPDSDGRLKTIVMKTDGGDGTLTVTNGAGFTTVTFNDVGDSITFLCTDSKWYIFSQYGVTIA